MHKRVSVRNAGCYNMGAFHHGSTSRWCTSGGDCFGNDQTRVRTSTSTYIKKTVDRAIIPHSKLRAFYIAVCFGINTLVKETPFVQLNEWSCRQGVDSWFPKRRWHLQIYAGWSILRLLTMDLLKFMLHGGLSSISIPSFHMKAQGC